MVEYIQVAQQRLDIIRGPSARFQIVGPTRCRRVQQHLNFQIENNRVNASPRRVLAVPFYELFRITEYDKSRRIQYYSVLR